MRVSTVATARNPKSAEVLGEAGQISRTTTMS